MIDYQRMTQKSLEALESARNTALEYGNQQLETCHLWHALLTQEKGLIPQILLRTDVDVEGTVSRLAAEIGRLPKVSGSNGEQIYLSASLNTAFDRAEKEAERLKDIGVFVCSCGSDVIANYCPNCGRKILWG